MPLNCDFPDLMGKGIIIDARAKTVEKKNIYRENIGQHSKELDLDKSLCRVQLFYTSACILLSKEIQ